MLVTSARTITALFLSSLLLVSGLLPAKRAVAQAQQPAQPVTRQRRASQTSTTETPTAQPSPTVNQTGAQDDTDIVRVDTDLTNVLMTALDREHHFVTNLSQQDVRILEDGVQQDISIFQRETDLPLSLAILIDTSKSQEDSLPDEKAAATAFVESVIRPDRDMAAIIRFTGEAEIEQELTNNMAALKKAIDRVQFETPPGGCEGTSTPDDLKCRTGIWDAVWATTTEMLSQTPENRRRAIILLTDGEDTSSTTKRQEAIDLANKFNVTIYAITIKGSEGYDGGALRKLSEGTGGRAFLPDRDIPDRAALLAAFAQIQQELRSQYLIAYSPRNKARDGSFRKISIEVINPTLKKQKLKLMYRQGYYARTQARS
ncbi:MAG TPA: VWA domain-containing protein [Pyrinomonadaceae bacterium]|nr:VWA domain-containing protein [Pyrinomonadaceae bacterium]